MMRKRAFFTATSWESYSEQGPEYKKIQDWWASNWSKMPGANDSSYGSWTSWYNEKYYGEWGSRHRGPEETLNAMIADSSKMTAPITPSRKERISERIDSFKGKFEGVLPRIREKVSSNSGVNLDDLADDTKDFLYALSGVAKELGYPAPHVTDGHRSSLAQARVMASNWKNYGGSTPLSAKELSRLNPTTAKKLEKGLEGRPISKGAVYLIGLYGGYDNGEYACFVNNVYTDYGINRESRAIVSDYVDANVPKTSHLAYPAKAVDLRLTDGIKDVLEVVEKSGEFKMKTLYEKNHFHVKIDGKA